MKKGIENILKKIEKELDHVDELLAEASEKCVESKYRKKDWECYQQRYEYYKGLLMAKTIISKEIKKLNK